MMTSGLMRSTPLDSLIGLGPGRGYPTTQPEPAEAFIRSQVRSSVAPVTAEALLEPEALVVVAGPR